MKQAPLPSSARTDQLILLAALGEGERTGFQLIRLLEVRGDAAFTLREGAIYPLLYQLEAAGHVRTQMHDTVDGPRRFYRLTRQGTHTLGHEREHWLQLNRAFGASLGGDACARKSD